MNQWYFDEDITEGSITAKKHLKSGHKQVTITTLPENAIIFCFGKWEKFLSNNFHLNLITEKLPRFLSSTPVYNIKGNSKWCFLHGGYGAPMMADTIETIHELGVKNAILVGFIGGFGDNVDIDDIVIPQQILSEEGTSIHYGYQDFAQINSPYDLDKIKQYFQTNNLPAKILNTVSTDAVYRQTLFKENLWKELGYQGVDMEGSAFVNVCNYFKITNTVIFRVSDKHGTVNNTDWTWGQTPDEDFVKTLINYFVFNEKFVK